MNRQGVVGEKFPPFFAALFTYGNIDRLVETSLSDIKERVRRNEDRIDRAIENAHLSPESWPWLMTAKMNR